MQKILDIYSNQQSDFVNIDRTNPFWDHRELHLINILDTNAMIIRHDPEKLTRMILEIIHAT